MTSKGKEPLSHRDIAREITIPIDSIALKGDLYLPKRAKGLVIFAHGSGSSRHSVRNRYVAEVLHQHRLGTLLIDLLSIAEEQIDQQTRHLRFDISLLAHRLVCITEWIKNQAFSKQLGIGYFGASTGGAAALIAAAKKSEYLVAVVSRGGRPDLAGEYLTQVKAPTLLLVGGRDHQVIELNQQALTQLNIQSQLDIIPNATHLFEEPGTLESVAHLAAQWFEQYMEAPTHVTKIRR